MKAAPQMEAELAQLNRDYEINRKNYEDLVARRESIAMSGQLESASSLADFRVIDPPRANPRPVAPNRALLMPLALLAALGAGLGVAFLMSQVRPVFFEAGSLRTATDLLAQYRRSAHFIARILQGARPADLASADDVVIGRDYPLPIVQHDEARTETLARYAVVSEGKVKASETPRARSPRRAR